MPLFSYKARTRDGQDVSGTLMADNQQAVLRLLEDQSLFPVAVKHDQAGRAITGRTRKVKRRLLATMYAQLADLLRAGVPVLRALDVLSRQQGGGALSQILAEVRDDVAGGENLADAMAKHPAAFSELHVSMVRAGERGGFLEDVLARIAIFTDRQNELRDKLVGSMIYPAVLTVGGVAAILVILIVAVPKVRTILPDEGLSILTRMVFWFSDLLMESGLFTAGIVFVGVLLAAAWFRSDSGARLWDRLQLRLPVVGRLISMVAICRFCRILGTLLANGVPILQALKVARDSAGNRVLESHIDEATESVRRGDSLAAPLGAGGLFPLDILDMIAVGEESNNLENVLVQIADANEARTARLIDLAVRMIEPLILIIFAAIILMIALGILIPILSISSQIG